MFITLLLLAPALCEWVEISQHHVRKPTRTHTFKPTERLTEPYFEDTTRTTKIYLNQTLTERPWSKGNINKVTKLGNIQRVQLDDIPIKAPSFSVHPEKNPVSAGITKTVSKNDINESVSGDYLQIKRHKISGDDDENLRQITNRTPNIQKVHTQLISNSAGTFQEPSTENDRTKSNLNELQQTSFSKPGSRNPNIDNIEDRKIAAAKQKTNITFRTQIFGLDKTNKNSLFLTEKGATNIRRSEFSKFPDVNSNNTEKTSSAVTMLSQRNKGTINLDKKYETSKIEDNGADRDGVIRSKLTNHEFVTKVDKRHDDDMDATVDDDNDDPKIVHSGPEIKNSDGENFGQEKVNEASMNKANSIENLIKFMKVVADTIKKNTRRSVNSKTRYLTNLKNTILANIAERIDAAWPDDEPQTHPRTSRAAPASPRGHVEIPSSESALMTISFLTFAVFLIKLVLQVIQTYKNKAMMVTPAVVAVGRAATKRISKP